MSCGGPAIDEPIESVATVQEAVQATYQVAIQVVVVDRAPNWPAFTASMMTNALAVVNPIFASTGVQFTFNPSDVVDPGLPNCSDSTLGAYGDTIKGKIAVFYCPSRGGSASSGGPNAVAWAGDTNALLAHELGHYFDLGHTFRGCWVPEENDKPTPNPNDGCGGVWYSVEHCIKAKLDGAPLPPECPNLPTGLAIRDYLLDGDGLSDTGISLHLHPPGVGDACSPNLTVPLVVHFANGTTNNYSFTPDRSNVVGYYFGCNSTIPQGLSPTQRSIIRNKLFLGNRSHLINKTLVSWSSAFSDSNGWANPQYYSTIAFPDLDNNGRADLCGRGNGGINCGISNGSAFSSPSVWSSAFSDGNGWSAVQYYSTIQYPNVNGMGGADVCGRGSVGVACATSTGSGFSSASTWLSDFSDANGWNAEKYYSTIGFPNLDGTGGADVCGRGIGGILCAISNGSSFTGLSTWQSNFSDANGWNLPQYYRTIRFPNVNGTGGADLCARGGAGVLCATSNGSSFTGLATWASVFSDANGWNAEKYYSTLAYPDLNGDGKADVCGRGVFGITCGLSNGSAFTNLQTWSTTFSDAAGWDQPQHYKTLRFPDLDNDGKADICGRGTDGVYCAYSNGTSFVDLRRYSDGPSNAAGWNQPQYYSTIQFAKVDTDSQPELCARGVAGILCEKP